MLDIKFVRENPELVKENIRKKFQNAKLPLVDEAIALGYTELWQLADFFGVTESFMRKAVCFYVHGNLASELYF